MARILPLIPLILWLAFAGRAPESVTTSAGGIAERTVTVAVTPTGIEPIVMLAGTACIVLVMVIWSRMVVRSQSEDPGRVTTRFQQAMLLARIGIVAWFGYALYNLGFGEWVESVLRPIAHLHVRLPGAILGTLPAMLGLTALWLAAYPVDQTTREHNVFTYLNDGIPVHAQPTLGQYVSNQFRLQILFTIAPLVPALLIRDIVAAGCSVAGMQLTELWEGTLWAVTIGATFVLAPVLLKWILRAHSLPDSPLRYRLLNLSKQLGVRCKDILLWPTGYTQGNAAVMGIVPQFRYVLLTDLLVETLDERQIEAVFAHEAGHVRHRHMIWYVVFVAVFMLTLIGPVSSLQAVLEDAGAGKSVPLDLVVGLGSVAAALVIFGMLSRLFERQADLFAARSMELTSVNGAAHSPLEIAVGPNGAATFIGALRRVAEINHMPADHMPRRRAGLGSPMALLLETAQNFQHPKIPDRIDHVMQVSLVPDSTTHFDRRVMIVTITLLTLAALMGAWVAVTMMRG
ncbi:MAG: M48 family metallopeptidase [Tepidisphaeraceae bacterium]